MSGHSLGHWRLSRLDITCFQTVIDRIGGYGRSTEVRPLFKKAHKWSFLPLIFHLLKADVKSSPLLSPNPMYLGPCCPCLPKCCYTCTRSQHSLNWTHSFIHPFNDYVCACARLGSNNQGTAMNKTHSSGLLLVKRSSHKQSKQRRSFQILVSAVKNKKQDHGIKSDCERRVRELIG